MIFAWSNKANSKRKIENRSINGKVIAIFNVDHEIARLYLWVKREPTFDILSFAQFWPTEIVYTILESSEVVEQNLRVTIYPNFGVKMAKNEKNRKIGRKNGLFSMLVFFYFWP